MAKDSSRVSEKTARGIASMCFAFKVSNMMLDAFSSPTIILRIGERPSELVEIKSMELNAGKYARGARRNLL